MEKNDGTGHGIALKEYDCRKCGKRSTITPFQKEFLKVELLLLEEVQKDSDQYMV